MSSNNIDESDSWTMDMSMIKDELYTFCPEEREGIVAASKIPGMSEEILRNLHQKRKSEFSTKKKQLLAEQQKKRWEEKKKEIRAEQPYLDSTQIKELENILNRRLDRYWYAGVQKFRFNVDEMDFILAATIHYRESFIKEVTFEYTKFPEGRPKRTLPEDEEDEEDYSDEGEEDIADPDTITYKGVEYQKYWDEDEKELLILTSDDLTEVGKWNEVLSVIEFNEGYEPPEGDDM